MKDELIEVLKLRIKALDQIVSLQRETIEVLRDIIDIKSGRKK